MPQYAAVDIGSNSVRMLVAEVTTKAGRPQIRRLAEERQVTRLGESVFTAGRLSEAAISDVCGVLERMKTIWQGFPVTGVRAVATSATRDAGNQQDFVNRASLAIGTRVETISGQEEARLIHLGVETSWPHPDKRLLIVDVGGGSAELIAAENGRMVRGDSRPLGAVRLQTAFLKSDPPDAKELTQMTQFIQAKLAPTIARIGTRAFQRMIATSASASAAISAVHRIPRSDRDQADRRRVTAAQLRRLYRDLSSRTLAQRRRVTGIGPRRAEIIVPGVAVFLAVLEALKLPSLYYSSAGLRDGLVADLAARGSAEERGQLSAEQRKVVIAMARRFGVDVPHARRVAEFAQDLFTALQPLHRLTAPWGRLLEAACYLRDSGHFISGTSHHKHSEYIVANSDLAGFRDDERKLVAHLCRYHRKSLPSERHTDYSALPPESQAALLRLIPILRLADGLEQEPEHRVSSVSCSIGLDSVALTLRTNLQAELEQWAVEQVGGPFRSIYGKSLVMKVERI
jgi:exopolyphosphatase/guanosine-5'-triphosphate,3'-diphosphate pyrophosphatase